MSVADKLHGRAISRDRMLTTRTLGSVRRRQTKQGNVLLQEVDAGKPCLACNNCKDGFALHVWRKTCRNCFCRREDHDIDIIVDDPSHVPTKKLTPGLKPGAAGVPVEQAVQTGRKWRKPSSSASPDLDTVAEAAEEEVQESLAFATIDEGPKAIVEENDSPYAWIPSGLTQRQIEKFMDALPPDARPENTAEGQQKRARRRLNQLPLHDMDAAACAAGMDKESEEALKAFVQQREDKDIGEGTVAEEVELKQCAKCQQSINIGDMSIASPRLSNKYFHPQCFVCSECNQFLVDLIHFVKEGQLYCGRHHAEKVLPRCNGCDELIFASSFTVAQGKKWHANHFCCMACDRALAAEQSEEFVQYKDNVVCMGCYDSKLSKRCTSCNEKIAAGDSQLSSGDYQWHTACFTCSSCSTTLDASQFLMKEQKLFCSSCYVKDFGASCASCKEPIDPSTRSLGVGDKKWHAKCFVCAGCQTELAGKPFVDHAQGLFCVPCYEQKHASRCKGCNKPLGQAGGLRYKDDIYHETCFVCSFCQSSLAGQKFVKKEDKFCCQVCFSQKLGPKCFACKKVITKETEGTDSYMTHNSKSWHLKCFLCVNCGKNLEGSRFSFNDNVLSCGLCK